MSKSDQIHSWYFSLSFGRTGFPARVVLLLGILLLQMLAGFAQEDSLKSDYQSEAIQTVPFDRSTWSEAIEGLHYFGEDVPDQREEQIRQTPSSLEQAEKQRPKRRRTIQLDAPWLVTAGKISLILIAAGVLFLLLRAFLGLEWIAPKGRPEPGEELSEIDVERIEENMEAYDLNGFIAQALQAGRYDLAIRLRYLSVLKALSTRRLIEWKKEKTNRDYLAELKDFTQASAFRRITGIFEAAWYGQHPVSAAAYRRLETEFLTFLSRLEQRSTPTRGAANEED